LFSQSDFEELHSQTTDGRSLACWISRATAKEAKGVIIVASAFGRCMHHNSSIASYLINNGYDVVRYDSINHVGMSYGEMMNFTMGDALLSANHAVDLAKALFPARTLGFFSTSITSRIAFALAAQRDDIDFLITLSGVVNLQKTLARVFGEDYCALQLHDVPHQVIFEGLSVGAKNFYQDMMSGNWLSLESTRDTIMQLKSPMTCFASSDDDWVEISEVKRIFSELDSRSLSLIELEGCGHDLGENPAMARMVMRDMVKRCYEYCGFKGALIREPSYNMLLKTALQERRIQRKALSAEVTKSTIDYSITK